MAAIGQPATVARVATAVRRSPVPDPRLRRRGLDRRGLLVRPGHRVQREAASDRGVQHHARTHGAAGGPDRRPPVGRRRGADRVGQRPGLLGLGVRRSGPAAHSRGSRAAWRSARSRAAGGDRGAPCAVRGPSIGFPASSPWPRRRSSATGGISGAVLARAERPEEIERTHRRGSRRPPDRRRDRGRGRRRDRLSDRHGDHLARQAARRQRGPDHRGQSSTSRSRAPAAGTRSPSSGWRSRRCGSRCERPSGRCRRSATGCRRSSTRSTTR